jgi:hypothetical protein
LEADSPNKFKEVGRSFKMSDTNYRIRYKMGDFEVEVQGDKAWVEAKFKELTTPETSPKVVTTIQPATKVEGLPESLAEFLNQLGNPEQHSTIVVIFGYWLVHKERYPSFNVKDIEKCYTDTRISTSTNTSQYLNEAQADGYFKRLDEKKDNLVAWTITPTGDKFVKEQPWKTVVK